MDFVPQEEFLQKLLEVLEDSFIPDSEIQKNVQDNLRTLQNNPEFCNYLLMVCDSRQQFDDKMRALAALILKNTIVYFYNNIPAYLRQHMQQKCLNLLTDHSKEVRLGASVLINVVVQKEGIASIGNVIPHLLGLLVLDESEICTSAMKTLALIVEDYMHINMRMQTWQIDNQIVDLLTKFIELTGHQCIDVRHRAFRALNDVLQKHFTSLNTVINTSMYLEKLVAFANEEDTDTVLLVLQGFVIFISNQDEAILPGLNDVIGYILNKSTSEDNDVALQACEFWLAVSKLPTCVDILRNHLKHLLPVLLNNMKKCPVSLVSPLIKIVIDEVRASCKKNPVAFGFNTAEDVYEPLKLMQTVIAHLNEICLRYMDNSMLCSLPSPGPPPFTVCVHAVKNCRAHMEDRHTIIHDLNSIFNKEEAPPSSYYAVFDGHAGTAAATYAATHLHQFLVESEHFATHPINALIDAFRKTDSLFLEKSRREDLSGGTTAVCALIRPKEKALYIAWAGDSMALLAKNGAAEYCVMPHKPNRPDERERITFLGGAVIYWGAWRVNGQLSVSRSIGDPMYRPYITAEPEIREYALDGTDDFLVIACDGLWDVVPMREVAMFVYKKCCVDPDNAAIRIAHDLSNLAKERHSADNISVIVVFLREPSKIASIYKETLKQRQTEDASEMEAGLDNATHTPATNPFAITNGSGGGGGGGVVGVDVLSTEHANLLAPEHTANEPASFLFHHIDSCRPNRIVDGFFANGKNATGDFNVDDDDDDDDEDDEDMGPETDVDALDDAAGTITASKSLASMSEELEEKVSKEIDANIFKSALNCGIMDSNLEQQCDEEDDQEEDVRRGETPTPPADEVHDAGVDSDSEEDDEWNYIEGAKGHQPEQQPPTNVEEVAEHMNTKEFDKENVDPLAVSTESTDLLTEPEQIHAPLSPVDAAGDEEDMDNMSQLNPDAKEFVPVSPTHTLSEQPLCAAVKNEQILAQSPRRPNPNYDFNLPDPDEFETDVKNRPSDVYSNGHEENGHNMSSQEIMENLLNGKNIEEIEFQPTKAPNTGTDEFLFGPNAAAFSTPSKFMDQSTTSTKATYGDDTTFDVSDFKQGSEPDADLLARLNKEDDPMSMSFYQDKDDGGNPFDLNKTQPLPDTVDDIPILDTSFNDTISDMPVHEPCGDSAAVEEKQDILTPTTDLDAKDDEDAGVCLLPESPLKEDILFEPRETVSEETQVPLPVDISTQISMETLSEVESKLGDSTQELKFSTDDEIIERPSEPLVDVSAIVTSMSSDVITEEEEPSTREEPKVITASEDIISEEPQAVVCFASQDAELQYNLQVENVETTTPALPEVHLVEQSFEPVSVTSANHVEEVQKIESPVENKDISFNDDFVQQHEFIPETSVELAEAPEQVVIKQTPEVELTPSAIMEDFEIASEAVTHLQDELLSSPVKSTPEELPISPEPVHHIPEEQPLSPEPMRHIVEEQHQSQPLSPEPIKPAQEELLCVSPEPVKQAPEEPHKDKDSQTPEVIEKQFIEEKVAMKSPSPVPFEADLIKPAEQYELAPMGDFRPVSADTTEILSPLEDVTSSVKDDSPCEEPTEIRELKCETIAEPIKETKVAQEIVEKVEELKSTVLQAAAQKPTTEAKPERKSLSGKPKTTTATKKPLQSVTATKTTAPKTAASKPLASKTTASSTSSKPLARPAVSAPRAASKTTTATTARPATAPAKSRPASSTTAPKTSTTDKKPLTNGDAKPAATKVPPIRRPQVPSKTTTAPASKVTAAAAPPPPPKATSRPGTTQTKSTVTKTTVGSPTSAPRPRPSTLTTTSKLTSKSTPTSVPPSTNSTTAGAKPLMKSTGLASKLKPATAPLSKPRVPLSARSTTAGKGPDAEKQNKENVNKLTASRTASARTSLTSRKIDATSKAPVPKTATAASKTTATTKRPVSGRTPIKQSSPKEKPVPNGVSAVKEDVATIENSIQDKDVCLLKDISPVSNMIIDNAQLAESTAD